LVCLLETGRYEMALPLARALRPAILDALDTAHHGGRRAARRRFLARFAEFGTAFPTPQVTRAPVLLAAE
jgi:hypothetical protein